MREAIGWFCLGVAMSLLADSLVAALAAGFLVVMAFKLLRVTP